MMVSTHEIQPAPDREPSGFQQRWSQAASLDEMPVLQNPFRTPALLQRHKDVRVGALLRSARGSRVLQVDIKVWIWLTTHATVLALLWRSCSDFQALMAATRSLGSGWTGAHTRAAVFFVGFAALTALYRNLYASDPGWLNDKLAVAQRGEPPCAYCGSLPSARSKHSKQTGQCVHKFDHFCWLLATDIGDRNHATFWTYLVLQVSLMVWGLRMAVKTATACTPLLLGSPSPGCVPAAATDRALAAIAALIIGVSLFFFGYLLVLHTYLILTNQTTYEVLKGVRSSAQVSHLRHPGAAHTYKLPDQMGLLFLDELRGRGPQKPFSLGLVGNLHQFFMQRWPRVYVRASASSKAPVDVEMQRLVPNDD